MLTRRYAWYVLGLLTALNFINYVDRQMILGMYEEFERHFGLSNPQFGWLNSSFFIVHSLTTIPLAWLADHFDRRNQRFLCRLPVAEGLSGEGAPEMNLPEKIRVADRGDGFLRCVVRFERTCEVLPSPLDFCECKERF